MVALLDPKAEATSSSCNSSDIHSSSGSTKTDMETKAPFLVSSPAIKEPFSLSALKQQFTTQSTIYRRHEARLARSYALRDDRRPAFIRVLSGLPGFRMIFPPYQSETRKNLQQTDRQNQTQDAHPIMKSPGAYSEETVFAYPDAADNAVGPTSIANSETVNLYITAEAIESVLQAMFATGFSSGTAEYVLSSSNDARARRSESARISPFIQSKIKASTTTKMNSTIHDYGLFFHNKGSMTPDFSGSELFQGNAHQIPKSPSNNSLFKTAKKARPSNVSISKAIYTAFPTSLLFGTKTLLDSHSVTSDILSSAISGGVVGLGRLAFLQVKRQQQLARPSYLSIIQHQHPASAHKSSLFGQNVVAAILYFSIYDGVSSIISKAQSFTTNPDTNSTFSDHKKGTMSIVAGGALAGVAYAAAMNSHQYGHYGSMIWWRRIMIPAASRGAPIHACVFLGYEKMKEGMGTA